MFTIVSICVKRDLYSKTLLEHTSTKTLGILSVIGANLVPLPPHKITTWNFFIITTKKKSNINIDSIKPLWAELKNINLSLWNIEDGKREAEKKKEFGENFIELARKVYKINDQRADVKSKINKSLGSNIREVKSYY